ncbi:MAG TPA: hypothetical protein DD379_11600 [Cyanobacteria bacterium UBA11162]|nr:hypothetical protein [Cyanobacteria bacterium UBA11370]HBL12032.1 hypothetical protein [Cyanobacteria bacterium UBA11162]HBY80986.1 hypothetical protein [Cyanobacteria bacterium UBA11148]
MTLVDNANVLEVSPKSYQLAQLFAESMKKGQISFPDWYNLIAAPWDESFSPDHADAITRMIYGVRHGLVKVVEPV